MFRLLFIIYFLFSAYSYTQNGLVGDGFGTNDWSTTDSFSSGAGSSRILTTTANTTGDCFFVLNRNYSGDYWYRPSSNSNTSLNFEQVYQSSDMNGNSGGAFYLSANTSNNYVFKTREFGANPNIGLIVFEIQGDIRTISGVSNHSVQNIGDDYSVTATLDGALSNGQGVYLRYSNNSFNSSTIIEMTGSGTSYSANIPANVNTDGASVSYYVFTSGDGLTISHDDADFYTINLLNNSGNNYSYSVAANYDLYIGALNTDGDTWDVAVSGSYAYVADGYYVRVVDISDIKNPTQVGSYYRGNSAKGVYVSGNYLYVADGSGGLFILNVTDKTNPTLVDSIFYNAGLYNWQSNYYKVIVSGDYAYVAAYKYFYVFDISDPTNISQTGSFTCAAGCNDFDLDGSYVYLANSYYGLEILDVSDPSNPTEVAELDIGSGCCTGINDIVKSGNYAYASRYDNSSGNEEDRLYIYDVSDPTSPSLLSYSDYSKNHDGSHAPYAIAFDGTYVYSSLWGVIQVHNVSNVNSPTLHAFIETNANTYQIDVSGDYIFLSNRSTGGIQIIDTRLLKTVSRWTNSGGDNLWSNSSNWVNNTLPTSSDDVTILNGNSVTVDASASAENVNVVSGGTLGLNSGTKLSVNNDFLNAGTTTLNSSSNSYSALLVSGSSSGNITYNRYVNTVGSGEWDLVGSPVGSQSISGFVSSNSGSVATSGSTYAIGTYSNVSGGGWSNYTTSSGSNDVANAGNFPAGTGYQMASASGGTLAFTGTVATSDQTVDITDNSGSGGTKWNLVANPFPSYLNGNSNAGTNNFFSTNSGVLHGSFAAIYGWDADGSGYTPYNATSTWFIAPGQAFFVASANASGSSVAFNENMQNASPSSYDDFVANTVQDEVEIGLYNGDSRLDYTKLFFIPGLTLGLDKGYDAGHFNQSAPMMTRLSEGDEGYGMVYNAMGQQHLSQEVTIPLEINQSAGTNFTVRLESSTADDLKIYLQDTFKNTLTLLNESAFTLTAENDLSDIGRFNLITTPVTLSVDDITNNNQIRIYKSQGANYITVDGLSNTNGDVDFKLYNITGALVMSKTLDSNENRQHISSENLINGVYFAVLNNGTLASSKLFIK